MVESASLSVRGLNVALKGRAILQDVGFDARAGEVVGLVGPNGAGKSTLLRAVAQLIPAQSGEVGWNGRPVRRMDARTRATTLAYLAQGQTIHWPLTVRRLVELGRLPRLGPLSHPGADDAEAVTAAMAAADVAHLADRDTTTLSGGERARVLLARALAVGAPILLADEPTASLDPRHVLEIMALLRRVADDGRVVIAVMHDLGQVARFCDRVILLDAGRVVAEGRPEAVLTPQRLHQVYGIAPAASGPLDRFDIVRP
jgi:iron complex transport system ATP-binding protein